MAKSIFILFAFVVTTINCKRNSEEAEQPVPCLHSTQLPLIIYLYTDFIQIQYDNNHCGYLPLGKKNYWVYLDSSFDVNGQVIWARYDTVRFTKTHKTPDGIVWWSTSSSFHALKGYIRYLYSTDSLVYTVSEPVWAHRQLKWFYPITTDSTDETCQYTDYTSYCYAKKIYNDVIVPAGSFSDCILYTKKQLLSDSQLIYFKPGVGVLRSKTYSTHSYNPDWLTTTSTLSSYHIE